LAFLFQAHGFRGKARFVLILLLQVRRLVHGQISQKLGTIFLANINELMMNSSDSPAVYKNRNDMIGENRIIKE
jgi:hypothetical protein